MPRAATTTDAFTALAEVRRRQLVELLAAGERPVGELATRLQLPQPQVSKHLRVLREVGLVTVRGEGKLRFYSLDPRPLRPLRHWLGAIEDIWNERFDRLDDVLAELEDEGSGDGTDGR